MNDFTKDELESLLSWGNNFSFPYDHVGFKLMTKIRRLMDNYCEHEPEGDYHVCVDKCKHCGVVLDE